MEEDAKKKLRRVRRIYVKFKARWSRGYSLIDDVFKFFQLAVLAGMGIELWNKYVSLFEIPMSVLPIFSAVLFPVILFIGYFDQEKVHLTQAEAEYSSSNLNPITGKIPKMEKDIKEIKKMLEIKI